MKLYYFHGQGRAEPTRIMLHLAGIAFEDVRFTHDQWIDTYQAQSPSGQCPWLELDCGTVLTQSMAIHAYCAHLAGFLPPGCSVHLARAGELNAAFDDLFKTLAPTFTLKDEADRVEARRALTSPGGEFTKRLETIDRLVAAAPTTFYCGEEPSLADFILFVNASNGRSGILNGLNTTVFEKSKHIIALWKKIACMPKIQELYKDAPGYRLPSSA